MSEREAETEGASAQSGERTLEHAKRSSMEAFEAKVEELVQQEPEKFAEALVQSSLAGRIASLKFVYQVLGKRNAVHVAARAKARPSIADIWAADPEWQDEDEGAEDDGAQKNLPAAGGSINAERA